MEAVGIGLIIGSSIALFFFIIYIIWRVRSHNRIEDLWRSRKVKVDSKRKQFDDCLLREHFQTDLAIKTEAFYHTATRIEVFRFCVDYKNKRIAVCSFEEDEFKPLFMDFKDIRSYKLVDGITNTTSQSFTTGGAVGAYGVAGGIAGTDTYHETTLEQVKLRIDPVDPLKPAILILMFKFQVTAGEESYSKLRNAMEQIDSTLIKIVESNKE